MKTALTFLIITAFIASCGPSQQEIKLQQEKAEAAQKQQELEKQVEQLKQAEAIRQKKDAIENAKEELSGLYEVHSDLAYYLEEKKNNLLIAKANLSDASRVKLFVSEQQRKKDIIAWNKKIETLEKEIKKDESEVLDVSKKIKALEKIASGK